MGRARNTPADDAFRGYCRDTVLNGLLQHAAGDHYVPLGTKRVTQLRPTETASPRRHLGSWEP